MKNGFRPGITNDTNKDNTQQTVIKKNRYVYLSFLNGIWYKKKDAIINGRLTGKIINWKYGKINKSAIVNNPIKYANEILLIVNESLYNLNIKNYFID